MRHPGRGRTFGFDEDAEASSLLVEFSEADTETLQLLYIATQNRRYRILRSLTDRPRYPNEIASELDVPKPRIHHHLDRLDDAHLVTEAEEGGSGSWRYIRLTDEGIAVVVALERALRRLCDE